MYDPAEDLWDEAYNKLYEKHPTLVGKYNEMLLSEPEITPAGLKREKQLRMFIDRKLKERKPPKAETGETSIDFRKQYDRIVAGIMVIKPVGDAAAALDPIHVGLPWAGACLLLSVSNECFQTHCHNNIALSGTCQKHHNFIKVTEALCLTQRGSLHS
jgi:hypothetical protein